MRVLALLSLVVGFCLQFLLNGQPYSNAWGGMLCGAIAATCGWIAARTDRERKVFVGLGALLIVLCGVVMPGAWREQDRFNKALEKARALGRADR